MTRTRSCWKCCPPFSRAARRAQHLQVLFDARLHLRGLRFVRVPGGSTGTAPAREARAVPSAAVPPTSHALSPGPPRVKPGCAQRPCSGAGVRVSLAGRCLGVHHWQPRHDALPVSCSTPPNPPPPTNHPRTNSLSIYPPRARVLKVARGARRGPARTPPAGPGEPRGARTRTSTVIRQLYNNPHTILFTS